MIYCNAIFDFLFNSRPPLSATQKKRVRKNGAPNSSYSCWRRKHQSLRDVTERRATPLHFLSHSVGINQSTILMILRDPLHAIDLMSVLFAVFERGNLVLCNYPGGCTAILPVKR